MVWLSCDIILHYFAVEETYFQSYICISAFFVNYVLLYLLSIIFYLNSHILPESGCIYPISANKQIAINPRKNSEKWKRYLGKLL